MISSRRVIRSEWSGCATLSGRLRRTFRLSYSPVGRKTICLPMRAAEEASVGMESYPSAKWICRRSLRALVQHVLGREWKLLFARPQPVRLRNWVSSDRAIQSSTSNGFDLPPALDQLLHYRLARFAHRLLDHASLHCQAKKV